MFSLIIARCSMRDRCNQNDRQHFIGNVLTTVHVCRHGSANVQGRGHFEYYVARPIQHYAVCPLKYTITCANTVCIEYTDDFEFTSNPYCLRNSQLHLWVLNLIYFILSLFYSSLTLWLFIFPYLFLFRGFIFIIIFCFYLTLSLSICNLSNSEAYFIAKPYIERYTDMVCLIFFAFIFSTLLFIWILKVIKKINVF